VNEEIMKKIKIPYIPAISLIGILFLTAIILSFISSSDSLKGILIVILVVVINLIAVMVSMIPRRLIFGSWGSYLDGLILFNLPGSLFAVLYHFTASDKSAVIIFFAYLALGLILFNCYHFFIEFISGKTEKNTNSADQAAPDKPAKNTDSKQKMSEKLKKLIPSIAAGFKNFKEALKSAKDRLLSAPSGIIRLKIAAFSSFGIILLFLFYKLFVFAFCTTVESYSPEGEVPLKTSISVKFSHNVTPPDKDLIPIEGTESLKKDKNATRQTRFFKKNVNYLKITPHVSGMYRLEDGNTIIFVPDRELNPSTEYDIEVITDDLESEKSFILGENFSFTTPKFKVTGTSMFYNYDLVKNLEKEVICEVNFNCAVDIAEIVKNISMKIEDNPVKIKVEPSNIPTRFYIRSGEIARQDKDVKITINIAASLPCIGGSMPLGSDYSKSIVLPEKVKLNVIKSKTFPVEDNTFIAVLFNRPVSASMVKKHVRIQSKEGKTIPYRVETEYCYAVLQADFKPNHSYVVRVSRGLRSKTGVELTKNYKHDVFISDMPPSVSFGAKGKILPLKGRLNLEFQTLNLDRYDIKINKIFRNNLLYFLNNTDSSEYGKNIISGTRDVKGGKLNQKMSHYINLRKLHNMDYKGLFSIRISDSSDYWRYAQQYFLCTDLGLIAKKSGKDLIIKVYSISNLTPVSGVRISLLSSKNQLIKETITSSAGTGVIRNWKINRNKFHPNLITAKKGNDFSFLKFYSSEIDNSRFNTGGDRMETEGLKAFLTPERGVYRPGEKINITAIVRSGDLSSPPSVNVHLSVNTPDGQKALAIKKKIIPGGVMSFTFKLPASAKTGEYNASLRLNRNVIIGRTSFKIEEFIPDKIKATIVSSRKNVSPGKPVVFTVKGQQLFGPPASDRKIETRIRFVPRIFQHKNFEGYNFNDEDKKYVGEFVNLGESKLNKNGKKQYSVNVPSSMSPPSALRAKILTKVYDTGGRPVSAVKNIDIDHYPVYLGLKIGYKNVYMKKQPISLNFAAINPSGKYQKIKSASLLIKHRVQYSILKSKGWNSKSYESETYEEIIIHKEIDINGLKRFVFTPRSPGEYIVYLYQDKGMRTSKKIYVQGPGVVTSNLEAPENLIINFNKKKYSPGDTAVINIHSPVPGRLFFSIEREKVLSSRSLMLVNNKATISFPVTEEYVPNVYVSAFVIRKPSQSLKHLPMTSMGIKCLELKPGSRKLNMEISTAPVIRSREGMTVRINAGENANVVLAAVDEGILQITQFRTPEPFNFFYMKRALMTTLYSIFDSILPNIKALNPAIGGDEAEYDAARKHINPVSANRVKSVSLYSGVLHADSSGYVTHHFKIPDFNGRLRVMALGASGKKFGSASTYVTVADPVVLSPSYPRILAPGDKTEIPVNIYNGTGKGGNFNITMNVDGPVSLTSKAKHTVYIPDKSEKKVYYYCTAAPDAGRAEFKLTASGNNETVDKTVELAVRPARALSTIVKSGELAAEKSVIINVPSGFIKYGQKAVFSASPQYLIKAMGALNYLIEYPYGCAEQTASAVFGLLYFKELGMFTKYYGNRKPGFDQMINAGIDRLEKMQMQDGSFAMWPGGREGSGYITNYVSHLLIEAERQGFEVDDKVIKKIHSLTGKGSSIRAGRLDRRKNYSWENVDIYRLYLKALTGNFDRETMEFMKKRKKGKLGYINRCRLSMCYALMGDKDTAKDLLPSQFVLKHFPRMLSDNLDSVVKRLSIYLIALCHASPDSDKKFAVAEEISKHLTNGHFGTTQENALALSALALAFKDSDKNDVEAELSLDGKLIKEIDDTSFFLTMNTISGKKLKLINTGSNKIFYSLYVEGTKLSSKVKPVSNGISVVRKYFTREGKELNLSSVQQGQLIVSTITVTSHKDYLDNIAVVDMLPAGFEIENVRLRSRGQLGYQPPYNWSSAYEDIRDDRLILFTGNVKGKINYSYTLRAVSVGRYDIPQIYAEAMYDPDINSTADPLGKVNVVRVGN